MLTLKQELTLERIRDLTLKRMREKSVNTEMETMKKQVKLKVVKLIRRQIKLILMNKTPVFQQHQVLPKKKTKTKNQNTCTSLIQANTTIEHKFKKTTKCTCGNFLLGTAKQILVLNIMNGL